MLITADEHEKASKAFLWLMGLLVECGQVLVLQKEQQLGRVGDFTQHEVFKKLREMFGVAEPNMSAKPTGG
jgi:hypothetical protein